MSVRVLLTGSTVEMDWLAREVFEALDAQFSFLSKGRDFAPSHKLWKQKCAAALKAGKPEPKPGRGEWDGYVRLLRRRGPRIEAPAGLWIEIEKVLQEFDVDYWVTDARPEHVIAPALNHFYSEHEPRDYQDKAADLAVESGYGLLRLPIRSGKTFIASLIAHRLAGRTLFVVPSKLLLEQSIRVFKARFPAAKVTQYGDGVKDATGDIVVCTNSTLMKSAAELNENPFVTLIIDEVHHMAGDGKAWREALMTVQARFRFGMSATIHVPEPGAETETQTVHARAASGPLLFSISMSELIRRGVLAKPLIKFVRFKAPMSRADWKPGLVDELLTKCAPRTEAMIAAAVPYIVEGATVLFDCQRVAMARDVYARVQALLPPGRAALLTGESVKKSAERDQILAAFADGRIQVVVGNLLGEGVDMPHLRVVVNMEGGCSETSTIQRLRNLNAMPGKGQSVVIEAVDAHHPVLQEWTLKRIDIYNGEEEFEVEI